MFTGWDAIVCWVCRFPRRAIALWLVVLGGLAILGVQRAEDQLISSDMYALIEPSMSGARSESGQLREVANQHMRGLLERQQTWLVSHDDPQRAKAAAAALRDRLTVSGLYERVGEGGAESAEVDPFQFYNRFPLLLADDAGLQMAAQFGHDAMVQRVEQALYSNSTGIATFGFEHDPFLLRGHFLASMVYLPPPFQLDRGDVVARLGGKWIYLVPARLAHSAFDFANQDALADFASDAASTLQLDFGASVVSVGAVDYATENRRLAMRESMFIGTASVLLLLMLMYFTFRGLRPLVAVAFTVATGIVGGFMVCIAVFGSMHVLTAIGGVTLIGITVDYAFHLLADGFRAHSGRWHVSEGLKSTLPVVALGLLTTLVGFSGLYISGFRGLQELAVFSAGGLVIAFTGLVLGYPWLLRDWTPRGPPPILRAAMAWGRVWRPGWPLLVVVGAIAALALVLNPRVEEAGDIRLLAARSPAIEELQNRSALLAGTLMDSRFVVVAGDDVEQLLQREEDLRIQLDHMRREGVLEHFTQLSRFVPSKRRQDEARALHQALYQGDAPAIQVLAERIGLTDAVVATQRALVAEPVPAHLELESWLASPLATLGAHLWLGKVGHQVASVTTLGNVRAPDRLSSGLASLDGVLLVDNVALISEAFQSYVDNAVRGLAAALVMIALLMMVRFGVAVGAQVLLVPVLAGALALGCLLALGERLNLFHIVALALVLGTGMDYALFLKTGHLRPEPMLAVLLAAITTECAFGLLAVSEVPAIHGFGLTVALGTLFSFLLAPVVRQAARESGGMRL